MSIKRITYFIILAVILWGCSANVIKDANSVKKTTPDVAGNGAAGALADYDLFEEALSYLNNNDKEPNYSGAKIPLKKLVEQYPKSKWIAGAQALISSIDRISFLQERLKQERQKAQADYAKLSKEIEGLRDNSRQAEEKYSAEVTRLHQENEQLKSDIQQLKRLEVQLEKREKMLR